MEWVAVAVAVPMLAALVLAAVARLLPVHQLSRRSRDLTHRPDQVWAVLTAFDQYPSWRRRIRSVSRVPSAPHEELWRESYGRIGVTLRTEVGEPGRVLVRRVVGNKLEFGGSWRFELDPLPSGGTRLTMIELAEYYRPMHRLVARLLQGEGRSLDEFQTDLAAELRRQDPLAIGQTQGRPGLAEA